MSTSIKPIPDGYQAVIPYLIVDNAAGLVDFIRDGLGGEVMMQMTNPDGSIGHTEIRVEGCVVMLSQAHGDYPAMPCMLYVYVPDVDATYRRAIGAGATSVREPRDEFYGDRSGGVRDLCGNQWWFGTHKEKVSMEELERRHTAARSAH